jgi:acyl carrier protein
VPPLAQGHRRPCGSAIWLITRPDLVGSDRRWLPQEISESLRLTSNDHLLWEENRVSTIVEEKVIGIVSEQLGVPKEEVKLESSIIEDLKADSLDVVELVMELEDEFDITIPDDDYEKLKTVGDAIKYIDEKK